MKYFKSLTILLASAMLALSCQEPSFPNAEPSISVRYSKVLLINASPDAPSLYFQVNNAQVAYLSAQNTSGYLNVNASSEQFKVKDAVWGIINGDTTAQTGDLALQSTLAGSAAYTVFVTDTVNRPHGKKSVFSTTKGGLQFLGPLTDNLSIAASSAGIRFYNLAPGAPATYLSNAAATLGGASAKANYRAGTGPSFTSVKPGSYSLQVTANSISDPTVLASQTITLAPGKVYTVFLTGKLVGSTVKVPYALNTVQHN